MLESIGNAHLIKTSLLENIHLKVKLCERDFRLIGENSRNRGEWDESIKQDFNGSRTSWYFNANCMWRKGGEIRGRTR